MKVRFSERNAFGVLDHWLSPKPGLEIYIPMRVIANRGGCELVFTLFRLPGMTDEKFAADAEWGMRDLAAAQRVVEEPGPGRRVHESAESRPHRSAASA